jgi:hypothetical protein
MRHGNSTDEERQHDGRRTTRRRKRRSLRGRVSAYNVMLYNSLRCRGFKGAPNQSQCRGRRSCGPRPARGLHAAPRPAGGIRGLHRRVSAQRWRGPANFPMLAVIGRNPGISQAQLCAALGIKRANLVTVIDHLEALGCGAPRRLCDRPPFQSAAFDAGGTARAANWRSTTPRSTKRANHPAARSRRAEQACSSSSRKLCELGRARIRRIIPFNPKRGSSYEFQPSDRCPWTRTWPSSASTTRRSTPFPPPCAKVCSRRSRTSARGRASRPSCLVCEGSTFFSGADIAEFAGPPKEAEYRDSVQAVGASCRSQSWPGMHGTVMGGGLEIALACHYRVARAGHSIWTP